MKEKEFENTILSLKDPMYRLAHSLLQNEAEAQDAVQDILEKMWRDRDKIAAYSNPKAFLFVVVRNNCFDRIRKKRVRNSVALDQTAAMADRAGNELDSRDLVRFARHAMAKLPEKQRTAMHLRDIEGMELEEIAAVMNADENTVRSNLSRARKKVREEITKIIEYGTR